MRFCPRRRGALSCALFREDPALSHQVAVVDPRDCSRLLARLSARLFHKGITLASFPTYTSTNTVSGEGRTTTLYPTSLAAVPSAACIKAEVLLSR